MQGHTRDRSHTLGMEEWARDASMHQARMLEQLAV